MKNEIDSLLDLKIKFKVRPYRYNAREDVLYRSVLCLHLANYMFRSNRITSVGMCLVDGIIDRRIEISEIGNAVSDVRDRMSLDEVYSRNAFRLIKYLIAFDLIAERRGQGYEISTRGLSFLGQARSILPELEEEFPKEKFSKKMTLKTLSSIVG